MGNIFGAYQATQQSGGYLTPRVGFGNTQSAASLTPTQSFNATMGTQVNQDHWTATLGKAVVAAPVDIADSTAALFGVERGATNAAFWNGIGVPGMADWVERNQGGVEVVSGLLGSVVVGAAAEMAVTRVAGSAWFAATSVGRAATPLIGAVANAQRAAKSAVELAAIDGTSASLKTADALSRRYIGYQMTQNVAKASVSELAIAATMNKNTAVWSDDMGQNILFGALGMAVPGIAGGIFGRAEMARWANAPEIRMATAEAVDTAGFQGMQLAGAKAAVGPSLPAGKAVKTPVMPVSPSYQLTALALDARLNDEAAAASRNIPVGAKRGAVKTELTHLQQDVWHGMTTKGIDAVPESSFSVFKSQKDRTLTPHGQHLAEATHEDPTMSLGLSTVGDGRDPMGAIAARQAEVDRINKKPGAYSNKEIELLARVKTEVPLVLVGKRWMTVADGMIHATHEPITQFITKAIKGIPELSWKSPSTGKTMRVREDGRLNHDWNLLDTKDILGARDGMNAQLTAMKNSGTLVTVPKDATHIELDYAIELATRGGKVNFAKAAGLPDAAAAAVKSLALKAEALKGVKSLTPELRTKYNLPQANSVERVADPDGVAIMSVLKAAQTPNVSLDDLKSIRKEVFSRFDLTAESQFDDSLNGDFFNFGLDRNGKQLAPVLGFFKDVPAAKWSRYNLQEASIEGQLTRVSQLMNPKGKFIQALSSLAMQFPEHKTLSNITGLMDSQIGGTRTALGALGASVLTQAHRFRNNPMLLAAQRYKTLINRAVQAQIDEAVKPLSPVIEQITSASGARSKVLFDAYASLVSGWEIKSPTQIGNGMVAFVLDHESHANLTRMGKPIQKGAYLMNPRTGEPVVLDALGNQMRILAEKAMDDLRINQNQLRMTRGSSEIAKRSFYMPPKSTRGKFLGFTLGPDNKVVPQKTVIASSQAEFDRLASQMEKDISQTPGFRFMADKQIARFHDLWEQSDMDFIDPTAMAGPGGSQGGKLASEFIDPNSIETLLNFIRTGYENLGNGVTRTIFEPQMKLAQVHSLAQQSYRPQAKGTKNIFEVFQETMMGMPARMNPTGAVGLLAKLDDTLDSVIEQAWPTGMATKEHVKSILNIAGVSAQALVGIKGKSRTDSYHALLDVLQDKMPFKNAEEYAEYHLGEAVPWKSRDVARGVNRFGTAAVLRWGELVHPIMNMAGIITNMPGLVGARNVPLVGRVNGVGIIDTTKIMARGFKRMFTEGERVGLGQKMTPDMQYMVKHGLMTQATAELDTAMANIKPGNHAAWHKFVFGDPNAPKGSWKAKGIDGAVSVMTDESEHLSKKVAHFIGLELADYHGVTGLEARHAFAEQIANDANANYDSWNRPEIYQNALGSMYGLFMSYSQNYYQKLFSYMEHGDYKAVGRAMVMQASMFGFSGVPGARQLADLMGGEEDNEGLVDGIYNRFGPHVGSVVAQGGFNQIVSLFGLVPGMALQTRGDANFRHPSIDLLTTGAFQLPVGLEVMRDMASSITESIGALAQSQSPTGRRQAAEIMARHMPSRMLSGTISVLLAGGKETDAYGNVVSETTNLAESLYRVLGVRSARQQAEIEAYFLNQKALQIDAQRMDEVRNRTRSMVRAGDYNNLPKIYEDYMDAGGKPYNYSNWLKGIISDASETRTQNQLLKAMRSPAQAQLANRIELMTGTY